MSVRQSVLMVDTLEGQVRSGADVPSVGESWLLPLGCAGAQAAFPRVQTLNIRTCFVVAPADMLTIEVASIQIEVRERRDGRWSESVGWRFGDVNDLNYILRRLRTSTLSLKCSRD